MEVVDLGLNGALLLTPKIFEDERGFFCERFKDSDWKTVLPDHKGFVQDNYSWSKYGVVRGLHFQLDPEQGKLVTCVSGKVLDVLVDVRKDSPTYSKHKTVELDASKPQWVWIPRGFAHGFATLSSEGAGLQYKVDAPYSPAGDRAYAWDSKALAINWLVKNPVLSKKDLRAPEFLP